MVSRAVLSSLSLISTFLNCSSHNFTPVVFQKSKLILSIEIPHNCSILVLLDHNLCPSCQNICLGRDITIQYLESFSSNIDKIW
ncbi:hypothetical protein J3Q64DRAFT_1718766 [Phycomyces blakesleeanus]|uniref:Secreted protein n=1 Tax=Phycomyces blakesleeanus TaxID=4837 RepID=A0ABR3B8K3_PHYBL